MKMYQKFILFLAVAGLLVACSTSTQLRKSTLDPSLAKNPVEPFKKVFVMVNPKKEENRKAAEDKLVSLIKKTEAIPSYSYVTPADTSQKELVEKLIKDGFDGVITMRVKAVVQTKTKYKNTATSYESWYTYGNGYAYSSYSVNINPSADNSSPHVDVSGDKDYIIETNIYSLKTKKLLWSGVTASLSAKKIDAAMTGIVGTVKKELKKKGFLKD
jgi:hypothetical protein